MNPCTRDDAQHCWHVVDVFDGIPPQERDVCCWCGEKRVMNRYAGMHTNHGPHVARPIGTEVGG